MLEMKIADFNGKVSELWDTLMGLELQLVDQLEVNKFETTAISSNPIFLPYNYMIMKYSVFCIYRYLNF